MSGSQTTLQEVARIRFQHAKGEGPYARLSSILEQMAETLHPVPMALPEVHSRTDRVTDGQLQ